MVGIDVKEIEYAVVGGIISAENVEGPELTEEDFSNRRIYEIYKLALQFHTEEREIIEVEDDFQQRFTLFASWLSVKGVFEKYKDLLPLLSINMAPPSIIPALIDQIKRLSKTRKLKELAKQIASGSDIEGVLPELEKTISEVKQSRKEGLRKIDILSFMTTEPPKLDFVFNSLPASSIGILASPGGLGKSMFVLELLTAIATGKDITEGAINTRGQIGRCAYLCLEDPENILHYRIYNLMAFLHPEYRTRLQENLSIYTQRDIFELVDAQGLINQRNMDELRKIAEGKRLVVIDTLRRVHSADENKAGQMSTLLQVFEVVAKETGAAFLLVHHTGKAQNSNSRGSSVLYDNVRYQINLEAVSQKDASQMGVVNHRRLVNLVNTKSNYGSLEPDQLLYRIDHGVLKLYDAVMSVDY